MANTGSDNNLTFAISYGLLGGPAGARNLLKVARNNCLRLAPIDKADVVIAHSAGCWLLPSNIKPKLVVYIGMPLTTERTLAVWRKANADGLRSGNTLKNFFSRFYNLYYLVRQPARNIGIIFHPKVGEPTILPNVPAIFIVNRHDPWPRADDWENFIQTHEWSYLSMPGSHDNLWEEPEKYVKLIKQSCS